MHKILLFFTVAILMSCGAVNSDTQKENDEKTEAAKSEGQDEMKEEKEDSDSTETLQLDNGKKWKADNTTRANVASLTQLVNDSTYRYKKNSKELHKGVQSRLDTLVKQCKMTGPAHEALHAWLKPVLHDTKELRESKGEYDSKYALLRKDVQSYYDYFE
jgi:uncharacterized protein YceK